MRVKTCKKNKSISQGATAAASAANGVESEGFFLFYSLRCFFFLLLQENGKLRKVKMHCLRSRDGKIIAVILNTTPYVSEHPDKQREANTTRTQ